jgi:hypothetical protein
MARQRRATPVESDQQTWSQSVGHTASHALRVVNRVELPPQNQRQAPICGAVGAAAAGAESPVAIASMQTSESDAYIHFIMGYYLRRRT